MGDLLAVPVRPFIERVTLPVRVCVGLAEEVVVEVAEGVWVRVAGRERVGGGEPLGVPPSCSLGVGKGEEVRLGEEEALGVMVCVTEAGR